MEEGKDRKRGLQGKQKEPFLERGRYRRLKSEEEVDEKCVWRRKIWRRKKDKKEKEVEG